MQYFLLLGNPECLVYITLNCTQTMRPLLLHESQAAPRRERAGWEVGRAQIESRAFLKEQMHCKYIHTFFACDIISFRSLEVKKIHSAALFMFCLHVLPLCQPGE